MKQLYFQKIRDHVFFGHISLPFLESVKPSNDSQRPVSISVSFQAGVQPGWTLRLVDGKVITKIDQLQPPVELQFQRDSLAGWGTKSDDFPR